jgi:hypothetical protein
MRRLLLSPRVTTNTIAASSLHHPRFARQMPSAIKIIVVSRPDAIKCDRKSPMFTHNVA